MDTGVGDEQWLASRYLEESRPWGVALVTASAGTTVFAVLVLVALVLGLIGLMLLAMTGILLLLIAMRIIEKQATKKLDRTCFLLRRQINKYGGKESRSSWACFSMKIGEFDFHVNLESYAKSRGEQGVRSIQFPKLYGSLEHVMSEVKAYCRRFEAYAKDL